MYSLRKNIFNSTRAFSTSALLNHKVAVLGAGGGIGQPLSLLLKLNDKVSELSLFDIRGAPGVAADLSHIDMPSTVKGFAPENDGLKQTLTGADIIVIPAGVPRKPGMTRDDLFNTNASIVRDLAKACAEHAPKAFVAVIANPVNSTVPIVKAVYEKLGVYDPKRLFGVTKLDTVRANKFISEVAGTNPLKDEEALVVGGHSGQTIVPLFSHTQTASEIKKSEIDALVHRIQFGGDEVVKAKDGAGSATLSMAHAGAQFTDSLLIALNGEEVDDVAFVDIDTYAEKGVTFFAQTLALTGEGWDHAYEIEPDEAEEKLLDIALPELKKNIEKGESWIKENWD